MYVQYTLRLYSVVPQQTQYPAQPPLGTRDNSSSDAELRTLARFLSSNRPDRDIPSCAYHGTQYSTKEIKEIPAVPWGDRIGAGEVPCRLDTEGFGDGVLAN